MGRLRFGLKFALSGLVVFTLLLYTGFLQVNSLHQRVNMLKSERAAVSLMVHLVEWNKVLIESRRIAITAAPGDEAVRQRFKQQAAVVDRKLAEIEGEIRRVKPFFDMSKEAKGLRDGWLELQKKVDALPVDRDFAQKAFAAHGPEYGRLYAFMRDMGDRSGMALEPDLDLFYLGYPLANNTPSTAGITVRIAAYSTLNVARGSIAPNDKVFYEVTDARLNDSVEQSQGVAQVGEAVMQMDQATQQNAALVEEMAAAASSLKSQAQELVATVAVFKLGDAHEQSSLAPPAAVRSSKPISQTYQGAERRAAGIPKGASARSLISSAQAVADDEWTSL
jgi:hypothetical protein